jgi:hypothetical protein
MKFIIRESHSEYGIIRKYWQKQIDKGEEPLLTDELLKFFGFPFSANDAIKKEFRDFLGGDDVTREKVIKILSEPKYVTDGRAEVYFYFDKLNKRRSGREEIYFDAKVYGTYNDGQYQTPLDELVSTLDMTEYFEFKDYISVLIEDSLIEIVDQKTGYYVFLSDIEFVSE